MAADPTNLDNVQAIINAARDGVTPIKVDQTGTRITYLVPQPGRSPVVEVIDIEKGQPKPSRKRGTVVVHDATSFTTILNANADAGDATVYSDRNPLEPSIVAVLNGHGEGGAGWGDFRVSLQFRRTTQWAKWAKADNTFFDQATFAEFIEDNLEDIAEPDSAKMLDIVTYFDATRASAFSSHARLQNGVVSIKHQVEDNVKVSKDGLEVPAQFVLGITPIFGGASFKIPARFRYRISGGKLSLGYKLQRIETLMATIVDETVASIQEKVTSATFLNGKPIGDLMKE